MGSPIVSGTINVRCAGGSAPTSTTTGSQGAWQLTVMGQTLPCAVQVSGGTVDGAANANAYHAISTDFGTVNVTPLTDLLLANAAGTATPSAWFAGLANTAAPLANMTATQMASALVKLKAALPALTALYNNNPTTTVFSPVAGNAMDDMLSALRKAIANSGVSYAALLTNASVSSFPAPASAFGSALSTAYSGGSSSSTPTAYQWASLVPIYANGAISTYAPSAASLPNGKVMVLFAQAESAGNRVYASLGDYASGTWAAPVALSGSTGSVQGVSNVSGWNQSATATVVLANVVTGNALAAWMTQVSPENTYRVWVSTYTGSSKTWSSAAQVGVASQRGLHGASSNAGGMAVGWIQPSNGATGKLALGSYQVRSTGAAATDTLELGVTSATALKIGLSNADTLVAAWGGANQRVMLARRGASWSSPVDAGEGAPEYEVHMSLAVAADGAGALVWRGLDPSIHTAVFDSNGNITPTASLHPGSVDNTRPAVASLGSGKFLTVFGASSTSTGSSLWYDPQSAIYTPGTGWSTPVAIGSTAGVGNVGIKVSSSGDVMALVFGANQRAYRLASGSTAWSGELVQYNGNTPVFEMDTATGRAVMLWGSDGTALKSYFYR